MQPDPPRSSGLPSLSGLYLNERHLTPLPFGTEVRKLIGAAGRLIALLQAKDYN